MIEYLYVFSLYILITTLFIASISDIQNRIVKFYTWYPLIVVGMISTATYVYLNFNSLDIGTNIIIWASIFAFFILGALKLLGGADAWALIFISIFTIPFAGIFTSPDGVAMATYTNAIILTLIFYPIYNYIMNRKIDAPLYYKLLTLRIEGKDILKNYGYVINSDEFEKVREKDEWYGEDEYEFLDFLKKYLRPSRLEYTKQFIDNPEKYKERIKAFEVQKNVWLLNAIPFIVFIAAGFIVMIFVGDLFNMFLAVLP